MTTRSGQSFKSKESSKSEMTETSGAEAKMVRVSDIMKLFLEDRKKREEEIAEERRRREEEIGCRATPAAGADRTPHATSRGVAYPRGRPNKRRQVEVVKTDGAG